MAALGQSQPLIHTEEFIDMLLQFPNLIAWSNGHTHINTIVAHPRDDGKGGFWEITTASCIDFPAAAATARDRGQPGRDHLATSPPFSTTPAPRWAEATSVRRVWRR